MKKVMFVLICFALSLLSSGQSWKELGPFRMATAIVPNSSPVGVGAIYSVAVHPTNHQIIYAGSHSGGLWKTIDGGNNWVEKNNGFPKVTGIFDIKLDAGNPDIIYVRTFCVSYAGQSSGYVEDVGGAYAEYTYGIFISIDGGENWSNAGYSSIFGNSNMPSINNFVLRSLNIDRNSSYPNTNLYTITLEGGNTYSRLFKSVNSGSSWFELTYATPYKRLHEVDIDPINSNIIYLSGDNTFYKSTNGGSSFVDITSNFGIPSGQTITRVYTDIQSVQDLVYCLVVTNINTFLLKSTDAGNNWQTVKSWGWLLDLKGGFEISEKNADVVYIGAVDVIMVSSGSERTISQQGNTNSAQWVHADQRELLSVLNTNGVEILYSANDGGVSQVNDVCSPNCNSWSPVWEYVNGCNGMNNLHFYGFNSSLIGNKVITGAQDCGVFMYNENETGKWRNHIYSDGGDGIIAPDNDQEFYALGWGSAGALTHLWKSLDNGINWVIKKSSPSGIPGQGNRPLEMHGTSYNLYFSTNQLHRSTDRGTSWTQISNFSRPDVSEMTTVMKVAPSDENFIYVGFGKGYDGFNLLTGEYIFYRTINGLSSSITWDDKTDVLPSSRWRGVTDILVHPNVPSELWVVLTGYELTGNNIRIVHSIDAGDTWTSLSLTGLPVIPINCIEIDVRGSGTLYVGTDDGVYSLDLGNPTAGWSPFMASVFGNDMPKIHITDLEINVNRGILRAATFGRGIWESPLPCPVYTAHVMQPTDPAVIANAGAINWNYSDYHIPTGYSLTIDNTTIKMPQGGRFTISPGGKLIIKNNAKITNGSSNCAYMWDGIYIQGNTALPQLPNNNTGFYPDQGFVILENCTLEHAYMAVSVGESTPSSPSNGGVLKADNVLFINNRFSVRFYEYGFSNASRINDCLFSCTGSLPYFSNNDGSYSFVSLFGVKNIWLSGNTYENSAAGGLNNPFGSKFRGAGVISVNSTFWVTPSYSQTINTGTCVFPVAGAGRSMFKGLTHGVYIYNQNNDPTREAHVLDADFEDVSMGVGMNWDTKTKVYGNHFTWTANFDQYPYFSHPNVAVKTDFAEGSSIDRNEMNFSYQNPSSTGFHGVSVNTSNPGLYPIGDPNLLPFNVYKNNFVSGNGNLAGEVGLHIDGSHNDGLQFQCNEFSGMGNAVISLVGNNIPPQGSSNMAAGNKFNDPCINNNRLFSPAPSNQTNYFYSSTSNEEVASFQCSNWNNIFSPNANPCPENSRLGYYCPEGEGGGGTGDIGVNEQHIRNHTDAFTDALRLIQAGAYSSAQALLPQISNEQEHSLVSLSLSVYQSGSSYFALSPAQNQMFHTLFETGNAKVKQSIRSIALAFTQEPVQETVALSPSARIEVYQFSQESKQQADAGSFNLFPNPAQQQFSLTYRLPAHTTHATLTVQDVFGQVVWQQQIAANSGQMEINLPQKTGIFFCTIQNNERTLFKAKVLLTK